MLDFMNNRYTLLMGRVLLVLVYFLGGFELFGGMDDNVEYAAAKGIPGFLVWVAFLLKLVGGLAIIVGFQTRLAAFGLIIFTLCTAFIFHPYPDMVFLKEISMIGGLLLLSAVGPGELSLEHRQLTDNTD